ncbi:hypothetical protein Tsubulata_006457 [Turnera subulata]|uniref:DUF4283 domain-containing protein n=1 Tax=Turnera subulata TaxID=218843 RepID=A0A9Q0FAX1_9ROSI|nr:hypothetical protein Tsubulata_006457 [Turnera subulata]
MEDCLRALTEGPWVIMDHYLTVEPWEPNFDPLAHKKSERGKYAKVAVELDLSKPLDTETTTGSRYAALEVEPVPVQRMAGALAVAQGKGKEKVGSATDVAADKPRQTGKTKSTNRKKEDLVLPLVPVGGSLTFSAGPVTSSLNVPPLPPLSSALAVSSASDVMLSNVSSLPLPSSALPAPPVSSVMLSNAPTMVPSSSMEVDFDVRGQSHSVLQDPGGASSKDTSLKILFVVVVLMVFRFEKFRVDRGVSGCVGGRV